MQAVVVEHDPLSTPERVGDYLEGRGVKLEPFVIVEDLHRPDVTTKFPDVSRHDLVIVMGSPWSVYDPRVQRWVGAEMDFLSRHLSRGTPILGICFGAQIMSKVLGGEVSPSTRPEYGWGMVESTSHAIDDGPWFQYHGDEFTLPDGAESLAQNDSGLQAFKTGPTLAVQFHPEVTASLIASWCAVGGDRKLIDAGIDPETLIDETGALSEETQPALERMVDWWLEGMPG